MTDNDENYNIALGELADERTVFSADRKEALRERAQTYATLALVDELRAIRELLEKRVNGDISDAA